MHNVRNGKKRMALQAFSRQKFLSWASSKGVSVAFFDIHIADVQGDGCSFRYRLNSTLVLNMFV